MNRLFLYFSLFTFHFSLFAAQQDLDFDTPDTLPQAMAKIQANFDDIYDTGLFTIYQQYDADLTTYAGITPSANVQSFLSAADYAAMKSLLAITESDITDLGTYLTAETNDLSAAVTWANVPDANITETSVTQHQAALAITESQISDLGSYLTDLSGDLTPQLGGPLDVNGQEIQSAGDVVFQLGDNAGVNKLSIQDSDSAEVASLNSDGRFDTAFTSTAQVAIGQISNNSGLLFRGNLPGIIVAGTHTLEFTNAETRLGSTIPLTWSNTGTTNPAAVSDLKLQRDAANTLAQRNGTNAQEFIVQNTFTNSSNGAWVELGYQDTANTAVLRTNANGTGIGASQLGLIIQDAAEDLGFFGATPVAQPSGTGETTGFTAGSGTGVNDDSTFTGNIGSTAYRINDVVKALKQLGLLAE